MSRSVLIQRSHFSDRCNRVCRFCELSFVNVATDQEMMMKTIVSAVLALVAISAAGAAAEAHTATGTHLMWLNAPKSSPPYAAIHKNADCPNPPAGVK